MRRLNIIIICYDSLLALFNLTIGVFNLLHHHYATLPISFISAGVIGWCGVSSFRLGRRTEEPMPRVYIRPYYSDFSRQREEALTLELELQYRRRINAPEVVDSDLRAHALALHNLKKVVKAIGGTIKVYGPNIPDQVAVFTGKFLIAYRIMNLETGQSTCYYMKDDIPIYEKIASAALLLHNNPALFDFWYSHQDEFCVDTN